jgi:hypothetical protein
LSKSALEVVRTAFAHAADQLAEPFRFGQWARLAMLALATGELSSGGSCKGIGSLPSKIPHSQSFADTPDLFRADIFHGIDPAILATVILIAIFGGLVLMLVWIYVSSVCRFILFDAVLRKNCDSLSDGWQRWQGQGLRFFWWQLAVAVVGLAVAAALFIPLLIPLLATMRNHKQPGLETFVAFLPMVLVFALFGLVMTLITVLAKDFVIPYMAIDATGVIEGWQRVLASMKAELGRYAGYIGMKIVLAIGASIMFGVLAWIAAMICLIPVGILGVVVVIFGKAAGLGWDVFTITTAIVAGTVVLCAVIYVVALVCVPIAVFFPAYAMYFLAERYPALHARLYPPSTVPRPPEPPPLAPAPAPIG